jgi:hypothetical protein
MAETRDRPTDSNAMLVMHQKGSASARSVYRVLCLHVCACCGVVCGVV